MSGIIIPLLLINFDTRSVWAICRRRGKKRRRYKNPAREGLIERGGQATGGHKRVRTYFYAFSTVRCRTFLDGAAAELS